MLYSIFIDDIPNFNVLLSCLLCVCLALGMDRGHDGVIGGPTAPAAVYSPGSLYIAIVYLQLGGQSSPNGHIIASSSISPGYWDLFSLFSLPKSTSRVLCSVSLLFTPNFFKGEVSEEPYKESNLQAETICTRHQKGAYNYREIFCRKFKKRSSCDWGSAQLKA